MLHDFRNSRVEMKGRVKCMMGSLQFLRTSLPSKPAVFRMRSMSVRQAVRRKSQTSGYVTKFTVTRVVIIPCAFW